MKRSFLNISLIVFMMLGATTLFSQLPRLRFTQLPQSDSIGSLLLTNSQKNLEFTNNLRYLNNVFSVVGGANFDSGTLYVDAVNNRIGIGTSSPSAPFQIDANVYAPNNDWFLLNDTDGGGFLKARDGTGVGNITYPLLELQAKGDFGSNLSYGGAIVAYKDSLATENANDIVMYFDARRRSGIGGTIEAATNGLTYIFANNGTPQLAIQANGNVGIGTTSPYPGYKLDVNGRIRLSISNPYITGNTSLSFYGDPSSTTGMTIIQNGNVGIGTTSPSAKLEIRSDGSAANGAEIRLQHANNNTTDVVSTINFANNGGNVAMIQAGTTDANNNGYISFFTDNAGTSSEKMRIKSNGEVQIASTTDRGTYNLQVNGTGVWAQGSYVNGSDVRMKENIISITNALNKVNNLNPVGYNYKAEYSQDQSPQLGFIAQDVYVALEEYGEAVVKNNGDMLSMAYQNLTPLLTKAIQEQQMVIETQEQKIQELETIINSLITDIEMLKNK